MGLDSPGGKEALEVDAIAEMAGIIASQSSLQRETTPVFPACCSTRTQELPQAIGF